MDNVFFITGTDTEIGKTVCTEALLRCYSAQGLSNYGLKPIAAGCYWTRSGWRNEDAVALQQASSLALSYSLINPVALKQPCSPHIAAQKEGCRIDPLALARQIKQTITEHPAQRILLEGAGGWYAPITERDTMADFAQLLGYAVILVVPLRLGCLSHAQLSYRAIKESGLPWGGWVANCIDANFPHERENLNYLSAALGGPPLFVQPYRSPCSEFAVTL